MSREDAERRAHEEYARFEERRRLDAESVGEAETMKMLEQAARNAEKVQPSPIRRRKRSRT